MKTSEKMTHWRAWSNRILRQLGWYWYGVFDGYEDFFNDQDKFVLFFQTAAAAYEFEHGGSYASFRKRLDAAMSEHEKTHGALPAFHSPIAEALWKVSVAMTEKNLTSFLQEPEIKLILRLGQEFLRRVNLGYKPPFGDWPCIPPLAYFDGLRTNQDIQPLVEKLTIDDWTDSTYREDAEYENYNSL